MTYRPIEPRPKWNGCGRLHKAIHTDTQSKLVDTEQVEEWVPTEWRGFFFRTPTKFKREVRTERTYRTMVSHYWQFPPRRIPVATPVSAKMLDAGEVTLEPLNIEIKHYPGQNFGVTHWEDDECPAQKGYSQTEEFAVRGDVVPLDRVKGYS